MVNNEMLKMHDKNCVVRIEDITLSNKSSALVTDRVTALHSESTLPVNM